MPIPLTVTPTLILRHRSPQMHSALRLMLSKLGPAHPYPVVALLEEALLSLPLTTVRALLSGAG